MLYQCNQTKVGEGRVRTRVNIKLQNFERRFHARRRQMVGWLIVFPLLLFLFAVRLERAAAAADAAPVSSEPGVSSSIPLKSPDEDFVRAAVAKYGGRQTASKAFAEQGWKLLRNNQRELALQDFIRAWQLDDKNYQAFWGFGAILSEQGKLVEAIEQLEIARELNDDSSQRVQLLTDLGIVHSEYATRMPPADQLGRAHRFVLANNRFAESIEIDQNDAASWRAWAISLYAQERYSEASIKAKRAMDLRAEPFPDGFLKRLGEKMAASD
jgi:tetratricopeptide (TPR) repeat protein